MRLTPGLWLAAIWSLCACAHTVLVGCRTDEDDAAAGLTHNVLEHACSCSQGWLHALYIAIVLDRSQPMRHLVFHALTRKTTWHRADSCRRVDFRVVQQSHSRSLTTPHPLSSSWHFESTAHRVLTHRAYHLGRLKIVRMVLSRLTHLEAVWTLLKPSGSF